MKYLVAGLGNIGDEYTDTRHNVGFLVLDVLAKTSNTFFSTDRLAMRAEVKHKGRTLVLIKPTTFMNLSGKAIAYWMQQEKIGRENLLVVTDDLALPFGTLRMKTKGGDGGHNGLTSTIASINSAEFSRIRFGIGNDFSRGQQSDFVLGKWDKEELKTLPLRLDLAAEMVQSFAAIGPQLTMTNFNNK